MQPRDFLMEDEKDRRPNELEGRDFLHLDRPQESFGQSLLAAPYRIGEDMVKSGFQFVKNLPGYLQQAPEQFQGLDQTLMQHPGHAAMQGFAGVNEAINKLAQLPRGLAQYGEERLNLVPHGVTQAISKITPNDTSQSIEQLFGKPQYPGEEMLRGAFRNLPELTVAGNLASTLNPLKLTNKNIAQNIVKVGDAQYASHHKMYNKLWSEADKEGFNKVPYHAPTLKRNVDFLSQYYGPKQMNNVKDFMNNPILSNAQKAQSDVGYLKSVLEEKNRSGPLLGEEKKLLDVLTEAEANIESNMFKNAKGERNNKLAARYDALTNSYRENVVPYKYNTDIQNFKKKDLVEKQLVERLKIGPFGAKKGNVHPELYRKDALKKALIGLGITGGILGGGSTAYKYLTGHKD